MAGAATRPALGHHVPLGTLYDARTDSFLRQSIVSGAISGHDVSVSQGCKTKLQTAAGDDYQQKFDLLNFGPDLIASYFAGHVTACGSAGYLHSPGSPPGRVSAALLYRLSVCTERLNIASMTEETLDLAALRETEATHVIMAVDRGVQSVVELWHSVPGNAEEAARKAVFAEAERLKASLDTSPGAICRRDKSLKPPSTPQLDIHIFSDTVENTIMTQDLSEAQHFLAMLPAQVQQLQEGNGVPISYQLIPLSILTYMNPILIGFPAGDVASISPEYVKRLVSMFEASQSAFQSLTDYHACISQHPSFVSEQHLSLVEESRASGTTQRRLFEHRLSQLVIEVRNKQRSASDLDRHLQEFDNADSNPKKLVTQWNNTREKVMFAATVTAKGGIYVGYNGLNLSSILHQQGAGVVYVMSYSTQAMADENTWRANEALLFGLLDKEDGYTTIIIVDNDGCEGGHGLLEKVHIAMYQDGNQITDDVLEQREFMADKCLIRYQSGTLESEDIQRPIKRRPVKIPCPHREFGKTRRWICSECTSSVEFGYTDEFIYCDCGRSHYTNYEFRCCSPNHGPGYARYFNNTLLSYLQKLEPADSLNILILGETGVGKSTFINAFVNYLEYGSLDEAKKADLTLLIPCAFSTQVMDRTSGKIEEHHVKVGQDLDRRDERDGSQGSSATQQTMVYPVTLGGRTIRLIDTPGIGDTRGLKYDKQNMADILNTLSSYDFLHGILILVKSNNARLTIMFEFCMKELLTHLHRSAAANIAFGFTNTRISNYTPGDTFGPLKAILENQRDVKIDLNAHTVYCFDSESFRYLAAIKNNVPMPNEDDFKRSWKKSREEALRLINYFGEKTPHPVTSTISLNGARRLIAELTKPMADISVIIKANIANLKDQMSEIQNDRLSGDKLRQRLHIRKTLLRKKDLDKPRTVCSDKACRKFRDDGSGTGTLQTLYPSHCHGVCSRPNVEVERVADPGLINCWAFDGKDYCRRCSHNWRQHLHILYELEEYKDLVKDEGIETQIKKHATDLALKQAATEKLSKRIWEYEAEHEEICRATAQFCLFLKQNSITAINDKTLEYLDHLIQEEEAKVQHGGRDLRLRGLLDDRRKHVKLVEVMERDMRRGPRGAATLDKEGVDQVVKRLYGLKHFGENLKDVKNGIAEAHQATYREIPFRVGRGRRRRTEYTSYGPSVGASSRRHRGSRHGSSSLLSRVGMLLVSPN